MHAADKTTIQSAINVIESREYMAIEQNAEKPRRWGRLAKDGHAGVQFKDVKQNMFIA